MSVLTEINRIKSAVTDIVNAIKAKGVTVPTTAKINDLAAYISNIPTGASVETCNVTITIDDSVGYVGVTATTFASGAIGIFNQSKSSGTFTINNVVCGSIISVICNGYFSLSSSMALGSVGSSSQYLVAPKTAGNYTAQIIAYDD